MILIDVPLKPKEKKQIIEKLKVNISRICVSDSSEEIICQLGFATDRLHLLAYSRIKKNKLGGISMERLTQMGDPRLGYHWDITAFCDMGLMEDMIIDRLGAYEDTGLTPEIAMEYKKFEDELVLKHNIRFNEALERIEKYPQLQKETEQLKDELKHAYEKSNTAVKGYYELKQSYEQLQKENAELKELLKLAINELKRCADDNGGCYGCKNLDLDKDECICEEGKLLCNSVDNNMWQWQHADKLKELGVE